MPSGCCSALNIPHPTSTGGRNSSKFWHALLQPFSWGLFLKFKEQGLQNPRWMGLEEGGFPCRRRLRPGTNTQDQGSGQLTLFTVSPGEARTAGTLATDVVTAGAILTLAHAPTVLPIKRCWAAWRNRVGATAGCSWDQTCLLLPLTLSMG